MKSKNTRILFDGEEKYYFDALALKGAIKKYISDRKGTKDSITCEQIYELIAEKTGFSSDAVKKWRYGCNGVGNMETVKLIAETLEIDYKNILTKIKESEGEVTMLDEKEELKLVESESILMSIYIMMMDFVRGFANSSGFYELRFSDGTHLDSPNDVCDYYYEKWRKIERTILINALTFEPIIYENLLLMLDDLEDMFGGEHFYMPDKRWFDSSEKLDDAWEEHVYAEELDFEGFCKVLVREFPKIFRKLVLDGKIIERQKKDN